MPTFSSLASLIVEDSSLLTVSSLATTRPSGVASRFSQGRSPFDWSGPSMDMVSGSQFRGLWPFKNWVNSRWNSLHNCLGNWFMKSFSKWSPAFGDNKRRLTWKFCFAFFAISSRHQMTRDDAWKQNSLFDIRFTVFWFSMKNFYTNFYNVAITGFTAWYDEN